MTRTASEHDRITRRAVLRDGAAALGVLFVVGALVMVPAIQRDLGRKANAELSAAGIDARIDFHGQDGTLRCVDQLDDPEAAQAVAAQVDGVRSVAVDQSCLVPAETLPGDTTTAPTTAAPTTAPPTTVPPTTAPPTTAPPTTAPATVPPTTSAATTTTVAAVTVVSVVLADGTFTLNGAVRTAAQRTALHTAAAAAVGEANVVDTLTLDPSLALDDAGTSTLTSLMAAMPVPLASGALQWGPGGTVATGVYVDEAARATFEQASNAAGVTPELEPRQVAAAADAQDVQAALNQLVAAEPFVFAKGGTDVSLGQLALLQRVAGVAKRFAGTTIEVQGYTDSEGDPGRNVTLSERRARAVADALVLLGVPSADVTSKGFGETGLVRDENGAEIPDQSRRVVFGVAVNG